MGVLTVGSSKNEWAQTVLKETQDFFGARFPHARILLLVGTAPQLVLTMLGRLLFYRVIWLIDGSGMLPPRLFSHASHGILTPNQSLEAACLRRGISSKKIHHIYPSFKATSGEKRQGALIIACDGSIGTEEGLGVFLRAVRLARDIVGQIKIIVGGSGADAGRLSWLVKTMGLADATQIIPNPRSGWLGRADIYALPTNEQSHAPLSLAQALAAGCAIVATDQLSHREFIEPNKNGVLVPPNNAEMLSQAIINLARNPEWMRELGENSSAFAREHFSRERFEEALVSLLV